MQINWFCELSQNHANFGYHFKYSWLSADFQYHAMDTLYQIGSYRSV